MVPSLTDNGNAVAECIRSGGKESVLAVAIKHMNSTELSRMRKLKRRLEPDPATSRRFSKEFSSIAEDMSCFSFMYKS